MHYLRRTAAALLAAAALSACTGDGPPLPPPPLVLAVEGDPTHGEVLALSATRAGDSVPASAVAWSVVPADAGEVQDGNRLLLLKAGTLELRGTYEQSSGSLPIQVAEAPPITVSVAGPLERGATVSLSAARNGLPLPVDQVAWTLAPADAGELLPGGQLRLLRAGTLQVHAAYRASTGSAEVEVAEPEAPPPPPLEIQVTGTLERGDTASLTASRGGVPVPASQVAWTIMPSDGAELLADGRLRLLRAGLLQVQGSFEGSAGSVQVEVAEAPPLVVTAAGRLERGSTVTFSATRGGAPVSAAEVSWSYTPAAAVEVLGPGRARLLAAGTLRVDAERGVSSGTASVQVAVPPTVVFEMVAGGNRDLYRVALDGGDLARLTTHATDDGSPTVAGGRIVFVSYREGNADLFAMPLAGGAATRITATGQAESAPALSVDGERLAYAGEVGGVAKIHTAGASGQSPVRAAPGFGFPGSPETSPAWAPSGDRLAFVGTTNGSADIFTVVPGGTPTLVAGGARAEIDPAWSPDGSRIAFASDRDGAGTGAIYVVLLSSGAVTRLSDRAGVEAEPTWTADGRLVYVEFLAGGGTRLVWIDPADPAAVHPIPLTGSPRRPAAAR